MPIQVGLGVVKNRANGAITAGTPVDLWDPAAGKKFLLERGQLSISAAGQIILKDDVTEILRSPQYAAAGVWEFDLRRGILSAAADNNLKVDVSANASVGGWVAGVEE